jgi:colicin import membrane protein
MRAEIEAEEEYLNVQGSPAFQQWVGAVQNHVERNWLKPISARPGLSCTVRVGMIPGWEVVSVEITQCNGDEAVRRSIEAAVQKSSPLPRPPPGVPFERVVVFDFEPEE